MPATVRFNGFDVDLSSGELRKNGVRIHLREQSFRALAQLLERPRQVVTREELRRRLWPGEVFVDFENNLNSAVARLREALGDSAEHPRFIETLPKRGYRFIGELTRAAPDAGPARPVRLAVLPYLNLGGAPARDYLSDAWTDDLITELAAFAPDRLGVIARTTAMRYRGAQKDIGQIGRELDVDYVVEGGIRCEQERVTITTQLIGVSDQTHLLARRDEADLRTMFDVRGVVAEAVAGRIGIARREPAGARATRTTEDVSAYHSYLRARTLVIRETPEAFATAKQCLEEAIARDARFALAYDALAELYWYLGFFGLVPPRDISATGMFYAMRALDIDETLAETHALFGLYRKELDFNWADVEREMVRAREIDAASPLVRLRYAIGWLLPECRLAEAASEIELALETDPLSSFLRSWFGVMLWLNREYDRAVEQARLIVTFDPAAFTGHWLLGLFLREQRQFDAAIAAHYAAVELSGGSPLVLGWLGLALGQAGRTADARAVAERLQAMARAGYVPPTSFAWTWLGLGQMDQAFAWMDRAVDGRDHMIMPIQSYPFLDPVRRDPQYVGLLRKLNYKVAGTGTCRFPATATRAANPRS
jgi:TolB-like protein/tetratricopeptide (TPR) repeat protein